MTNRSMHLGRVLALLLLGLAACAAPAPDRADAADTRAAASAPAATPALAAGAADDTTLTVYKSPTCGCCTKWVDYMREEGFAVAAHDTDDMETIKASLGVPQRAGSCHTAVIGGYVIEGHVPASDVRRLLRERPPLRGLAVAGMPMGSPGMEGPYRNAYDVLALERDGGTRVFATH
jgi:hypothetical protein